MIGIWINKEVLEDGCLSRDIMLGILELLPEDCRIEGFAFNMFNNCFQILIYSKYFSIVDINKEIPDMYVIFTVNKNKMVNIELINFDNSKLDKDGVLTTMKKYCKKRGFKK